MYKPGVQGYYQIDSNTRIQFPNVENTSYLVMNKTEKRKVDTEEDKARMGKFDCIKLIKIFKYWFNKRSKNRMHCICISFVIIIGHISLLS